MWFNPLDFTVCSVILLLKKNTTLLAILDHTVLNVCQDV